MMTEQMKIAWTIVDEYFDTRRQTKRFKALRTDYLIGQLTLTKIVIPSKQQTCIASNYFIPKGQVKNGNYSHGPVIFLTLW